MFFYTKENGRSDYVSCHQVASYTNRGQAHAVSSVGCLSAVLHAAGAQIKKLRRMRTERSPWDPEEERI